MTAYTWDWYCHLVGDRASFDEPLYYHFFFNDAPTKMAIFFQVSLVFVGKTGQVPRAC
jgi:hypothetical protein